MGQPGRRTTRNNIASKGKATPGDREAGGGDPTPSTERPERDLETLRYLGHKYCDQCRRIVVPQPLGLRENPGRSGHIDSANPLRRLLKFLSAESANADEVWGCPYCGRNADQLKTLQKKHLLPPHLQRREIRWRRLIVAMLAPLLIYILYVAMLPP